MEQEHTNSEEIVFNGSIDPNAERIKTDTTVKQINISFKEGDMRYETVGDYYFTDDNKEILQLDILNTGNDHYNFLIMIHELLEEHCTRKNGIKEEDIMSFDLKFEKEREEGLHDEYEEPGFDESAPYYEEHVFATEVEMMLAFRLGLDWGDYCLTINSL